MELKSLLLFFVAYNLFLSGILIIPLWTVTPAQQTTYFSDSDFTPPASPPSGPVRFSKPFFVFPGQMLSFDFQVYSIHNVTGYVDSFVDCYSCDMVLAALPLGPPPYWGSNGSNLLLGQTYNVTRYAESVLVYNNLSNVNYFRTISCNCTTKISGTMITSMPAQPSPYLNLSVVLAILGGVLLIPPIVWTMRMQLRKKSNLNP